MSGIVDQILGVGFVIIWLPLTVVIYSAISKRVTTISLNGEMGLFSAALNRVILSGFLAATLIVIIGEIIVSCVSFVFAHWKIFATIIAVVYIIYNYCSNDEDKDKKNIVENNSNHDNNLEDEGHENEECEIAKVESCDLVNRMQELPNEKQNFQKYCSYCGNKLENEAKFCSECGRPTDVLIDKEDSKIYTGK